MSSGPGAPRPSGGGNLFLVPLDDRRRWYRYHHLFGDVLRARLLDEDPDLVRALNVRASDWYERNGDEPAAIDHALAAEDFERAAALVESAIPAMSRARQEATLRRWLEALPDELFAVRPVLAVGYVGALMSTGDVRGVESRLRDAERWIQPRTDVGGALPGEMVVVDAEAFDRLPVEIAMYRTRTPRGDARAVAAALRSEWIKAVTVRASGTILALALGGGLAVSWAVSFFVIDRVQYVADVGFLWTGVTAMLAAIAGVLLFGAEVQHGTLASTLAARPARWVVVLAKAQVAAVLGLVLGAAGLAAGFGGAVLAGLDAGDTSSVASTIGWALLFTTLSAVLGLGISMVVRNSTAAIGGLLEWGFVVENPFRLFLADEIARFLPFVAGNHLLSDSAGFDSAEALAVALTRPENALAFGAYTLVVLLLGTVLLYRRDTT